MKLVLVSFGDDSWSGALVRLKKQATRYDVFSDFLFYNKESITYTGFYKNNPNLLTKIPEGFGAWIWKTYVIEDAIKKYPDADFIVYSDSGNEFNLNKDTLKRFYEYVSVAEKDGVFAFRSPYNERRLSHCTVINKINPSGADTNMMNAGFLIFKNCQKSLDIVREWQSYCEENNYLNVLTNKRKCCDLYWKNLNDQSVLSLVLKKYGVYGYDDEADWFQMPDSSIAKNIKKYPIFNARNKTENTYTDKCLKYMHYTLCKHSKKPKRCKNLIIIK